MPAMKLYRQELNGQIFRDPSDLDLSLRIKATTSQKTVDGVRANNNVLEIIANDVHVVPSDIMQKENLADPLSVRIKLSGSPNSHARLAQIFTAIAAQLPVWVTDENAMEGFPVITVPVIPAAE